MKKITVLMLIIVIAMSLSAQRKIWMQSDWTGGKGQNVMIDSTMYMDALGIAPTAPMNLDFLNDTNWAMLTTYPAVGTSILNKIFANGDTTFVGSGFPGKVSYSTNLGSSWFDVDTFPLPQSTIEVFDINIIGGTLYACGYYGGVNKGFVFRSFDQQTWDTSAIQPSNIVDRVYGLTQMTGNEFIAVAGNPDLAYTNMDGIILKSYDACSTWTKFDTVGFAACPVIVKINDSTAIVGRDAYLDGAVMSMTYDKGENWVALNNTYAWEIVTALTYNDVTGFLFMGDWAGQLAMKHIADTTWTLLDTADIIPDSSMINGINIVDTVMYITTVLPGVIYKSYDYGFTIQVAQNITDNSIGSMCQIAEHTYALAGSDSGQGGRLYITSYYKSGHLESSVFPLDGFYDPISADTAFTTPTSLYYWGAAPRFTSLLLKVRTGDQEDMSDADDWSTIGSIGAMGSEINLSTVPSVNIDHKYMQYYVTFTTSKNELTPNIDSILVEGTYLGINDILEESKGILFNRINASMFNITNPSLSDISISMYDISGRMVYSGILKPGVNSINTGVAQGKYIVKLNNRTDNIIILK